MMNFKEYISNDISEKKVLIDLLPKNTSRRKEKYRDAIIEIKNKYQESSTTVKKFIDYKYNKLLPKKRERSIDLEIRELNKLNKILILGNPLTSFFEKMELDLLLYDLMHYYDTSLDTVNDNIYIFIKKLIDAGINVNPKDFKLNIYSYLYINNVFKKYINKEEKILNDEFEKIFWKCPKVIEYIIINLRMLVRKNSKKLNNYINNQYKSKLIINKFNSYDEVIERVKYLKSIINEKNEQDEYDVVNNCIEGKLDINALINGHDNDCKYLMIREMDLSDKNNSIKFVNSIITLKHGLEEYLMYLDYKKVLEEFKNKYSEFIKENEKKTKLVDVKNKHDLILKLESKAYKLKVNKFVDNIKELEIKLNANELDKIFKQELILDDLYKLYNELNDAYFDEITKKYIKINTCVSDIFDLFDSYPYFNKRMIKKVFEANSEEEIEKIRIKIKDFVFNPHRKIIDMIPVFVEKNVPQLLMNGYRFENLNIVEESFDDDNINSIFEKVNRIILVSKIDKFKLSVDEINFLVEVNKLKNKNLI